MNTSWPIPNWNVISLLRSRSLEFCKGQSEWFWREKNPFACTLVKETGTWSATESKKYFFYQLTFRILLYVHLLYFQNKILLKCWWKRNIICSFPIVLLSWLLFTNRQFDVSQGHSMAKTSGQEISDTLFGLLLVWVSIFLCTEKPMYRGHHWDMQIMITIEWQVVFADRHIKHGYTEVKLEKDSHCLQVFCTGRVVFKAGSTVFFT